MHLSQLIEGSGSRLPSGAPDPWIEAVTADSREVGKGTLFVCVEGASHDGHDFAADALGRGAAAVIAARPMELREADAPVLLAADPRLALAHCAAKLHGHPDRRLALAGITGTNGKTTVCHLLESIATAAAIPVGVIGTVGIRFGGQAIAATHTTPDAVALSRTLAGMAAAGCEAALLEVSSHALSQERVAGLRFRVAAFTNLSRDHLDFHGDMEAYFSAKARLFHERMLEDGPSTAVINVDDPYGRRLAESLADRPLRIWRFSVEDPAAARVSTGVANDAPDVLSRDVAVDAPGLVARDMVHDVTEIVARDVVHDATGIRASLQTPAGVLHLRSPLIGAHNLQNLVTAAGVALALGWPAEAVERGLRDARGAPGRLERIDGGGLSVFVDYAHTDDALSRACAALREVAPRRLIVVFGCGGDRDKGKRPLMGEAAGRGAELAIVTNDNPRTEDPHAILAEIQPGLERAGRSRLSPAAAVDGAAGFVVEPDRRAAIRLAIACARPGDFVLVAGKGHEDRQIVGSDSHHFDDREEVRRAFASA